MSDTTNTATVTAPEAVAEVHQDEISYHAVEKNGKITAIWEMKGRKHVRTIDPRSEEGRHRGRRALVDVGGPHVERYRADLEREARDHEHYAEDDADVQLTAQRRRDLVQGFLYAPPMPRVAFERFLTEHGGVAPDVGRVADIDLTDIDLTDTGIRR